MKLALVTGASSGIGAATARHLAESSHRVVLVARRRNELETEARHIGEAAVVEVCDAASGEQVLAMAERVRREHGVPDVLVNCAGAGVWKYVEDTSPSEAVSMMGAPYFAAFNVTHAFMSGMLERRSGTVVHVNSPAAFFPWPASAGYTATRWALRGLHEALCQDLAGTGVQSCHAVFGLVDSPYFEHNPGTRPKVPRSTRLARTVTADECGRVIARLAERPRREVFYPFMLRAIAWNHWIAPAMVRSLIRVTGAKRPQQS